jgi:hypothetical protein
MANLLARDENGNPDLRKFENTGFFYGSLLGILVGVVIAGPHFFEWPFSSIFLTIAASSMVIGFLGWLCVAVATPSTTAVVGSESYSTDYGDNGDNGDYGD